MICEVCEKRKRELFSFDKKVLFCRKCAKEGIKEGATNLNYLWKYHKKQFIKFEIKDL